MLVDPICVALDRDLSAAYGWYWSGKTQAASGAGFREGGPTTTCRASSWCSLCPRSPRGRCGRRPFQSRQGGRASSEGEVARGAGVRGMPESAPVIRVAGPANITPGTHLFGRRKLSICPASCGTGCKNISFSHNRGLFELGCINSWPKADGVSVFLVTNISWLFSVRSANSALLPPLTSVNRVNTWKLPAEGRCTHNATNASQNRVLHRRGGKSKSLSKNFAVIARLNAVFGLGFARI